MNRLILMALAAALATAGCASYRMSDADRLELYRTHAGAPINNFHYFGSYESWTSLGDSALAVWTRPKQAYLLELMGTCPGLDFARAISVSHQMGTVSARFDKVTVLGEPTPTIPCQIREIRPLDVGAIRDDEAERRKAQEAGGT